MTTSNENLIKCIEADHAGGEGMKPLVIYHAGCTDGYGAAFAAWLKLGDEAEYLPMQYGFKPHEMPSFTDRVVYMVDFSWPRDLMTELFEKSDRVVWLDHHKTAFEMWCGKAPNDEFQSFFDPHDDAAVAHYILLDNNRSGALLTWEYLHPGTEVPMLIRHIDDRDRWQFKLEGSKELHAALSSYKPWNFEQWKALLERWPRQPLFDEPAAPTEYWDDFLNEGRAILRAQEQHVQQMVNHARKCMFLAPCRVPPRPEEDEIYTQRIDKGGDAGFQRYAVGLAVNASLHQSEVGHELANQSGTFGLVWYMDSGTRVRCSLRSNGDYDVSGIARAFGGGGHRNAAGFETDIDTLMGWLK